MKWQEIDKVLKVKLLGSFNIVRVRKLKDILKDEIKEIEIDLSESRFVDTEAIAFLYRLKLKNVKVKLLKPPRILSETLKVFGINLSFQQDRNPKS